MTWVGVLTARLAGDALLSNKARQDRCERKPGPADLIFTMCMAHCKRRPEAAISKPKGRRLGNGSYTPAPAVSNFGCRRMRPSVWMLIPDQDRLTYVIPCPCKARLDGKKYAAMWTVAPC